MRIVTFNDDFTDKKTDLPKIHGGVVMVQEAKRVNVRGVVDPDEYRVFQNRQSDAHAGSALYWRRDRFKTLDTGQKLLAKADGNDDMLDRHVSWSDVQVRGTNVKVRMASAHRPPGDEPDEKAEFDQNLKAFAQKCRRDGIPVVIGMDANFPRDPVKYRAAVRRLENLTGLEWHAPKGSIDGFLASKGVKFNRRPHHEDDQFSEGHRPAAVCITVTANEK
ncbi:MAG: hypothetical protein JNK82_08595 [Myxococcaceae bacterium]|nr:hypothetical protein [Myxococcaceae bacterium]